MRKLTREIFIEKSKQIYGERYDYSKVEYRNNRTKVCIICPIHGEFWQIPASHLRGCGCPKCGVSTSAANRTMTTEEFVEKAKNIHGDKYDYSKVNYINAKTKVCIICPKHGEFWETPINHLNSNGCYECGRDNYAKNHNKSTECFIEDAKRIHGNKYDYSKVKYINAYTKVCIICPKHGEFWQTPNDHLNKCGCPICNESHLEKEIRLLLNDKKLDYIYQCKSTNLKWLGKQSLDFYLPKYNLAIECQGIQHFSEQKGDLYNHKKTVERDIKKNIKCIGNGIRLLYYTDVEPNKQILIYNDDNTFVDKGKLIEKIML